MLAQHLATAISGAPLRTLNDLSRDLWRAHSVSMLTDEEAQSLAEMIHTRRSQVRITGTPTGTAKGTPRQWSYFPPKRPQRSPERQRSLERRRTLAASSPLPPALAARFTTGELAVLRIVADAVRDRSSCRLTVPEIAARSGTSETTVRRALKVAAGLGLITIQERRVPHRPNLSNVIRIISREWLMWTKRGGGFQTWKATDNQTYPSKKRTGWGNLNRSKATSNDTGYSGIATWNDASPELDRDR